MVHLTHDRLSELIGSIYDCVLAVEKWPATLSAIGGELGYATSLISVHSAATAAMTLHAHFGIDQAWLDAMPSYGAEAMQLWGGPQRIPDFPLEEPIVQSQVTSRSQWPQNAYYRDIGAPRGFHDVVMITLVRDSRTIGVVAFGRLTERGDIRDDELDVLRLLAPHLRRAVIIGGLLEQEATAASKFSDILENVQAGIVLVDEDCRIVHANAAGHSMLAKGDPIHILDGRVTTAHALTSAVLKDAVGQAARQEIALEQRSIDIPARFTNGAPTVLQVLPLRRRAIRGGMEQSTVAAIFVASAADPPRLANVLALLHGLTPAETRVFEMVVEGKAPAEISESLGVSVATVKTHLGRVFEKTGCSRQAELVAMAGTVNLMI
ncbi:LuxR C-terminal-related transcriptional regulator [Hyphomicrobium sp. LHD-15]|uniref:helix-turn-helix transcriptional regulator n=1 Tax=Hyphomicrobium sp. LHD-15 TaxID=3072142 RepID=UPI00280FFC82|nr:LuxR C-terminal-related transcriptional regulator [Hyphomicrobium sp. LHD-15]MDQ8700627.1 LuxR C-terminal-related transcriptional regulator [Hyphomicrobium sp. LHD-15]